MESSTPVDLSYQATDGMSIDLEDSEDVRAFRVYASREPIVTIKADFDQSKMDSLSAPSMSSAPSAATETPGATPSKSRGRRGRSKTTSSNAQVPENDASSAHDSVLPPPPSQASATLPFVREDTGDSSMAEVSAGLHQANDVQETPKSANRKRKSKPNESKPATGTTCETIEAPAQSSTPVAEPGSAAQPAIPPTSHSNEHEQRGTHGAASSAVNDESRDDDEDVPLSQQSLSSSQTMPPSSQTNPPSSQEAPSPDKPRRHRRTKAEMEAFRAEQAAKKQEKEQGKSMSKSNRPDEPDTTVDTTALEGDETTVIHEPHHDEHGTNAAASVQSLKSQGPAAIQQRLNELKAKKQRKNATEREEQKLLMELIGKEQQASPGVDTSLRE